jgi:hypothetical protein
MNNIEKQYSEADVDRMMARYYEEDKLTLAHAKDSEAKIYHNRIDYRVEFEQFIVERKPTIFWTVTFTAPNRRTNNMAKPKFDRIISDQEAHRTMTELIKRVNQYFSGRNKSKYMTGIGHLDYQTCGQPHYHWLIHTSISAKELQKAVDYIVNRARESFNKGKRQKHENDTSRQRIEEALESNGGDIEAVRDQYEKHKPMVDESLKRTKVRFPFYCLNRKDMDVQKVYSDDVSKYVAKVLETRNKGRFVILDKDGINDLGRNERVGLKGSYSQYQS